MSAITLPKGQFGAILADPPWRFDAWASGGNRHPENHYATQGSDWIRGLPIDATCARDAVLFIWTCCPHLPEALAVIDAWGFTYKTVAFSWMKANMDGSPYMGLGYWTRANAELCLLATRGHPKRLNADVPQAIYERRREHSRKPDCVHQRIERLVAGPYLELFGRQSRAGWTVWGNEATKFDRSDEIAPGHVEEQPALFR